MAGNEARTLPNALKRGATEHRRLDRWPGWSTGPTYSKIRRQHSGQTPSSLPGRRQRSNREPEPVDRCQAFDFLRKTKAWHHLVRNNEGLALRHPYGDRLDVLTANPHRSTVLM